MRTGTFTIDRDMSRAPFAHRARPWSYLVCGIIGHKPYEPYMLQDEPLMQAADVLGEKIFRVDMCKRCHLVYWTRC